MESKSFENLAEFKYSDKIRGNLNYMHKEIERRVDLRSACYQSVFCIFCLTVCNREYKD